MYLVSSAEAVAASGASFVFSDGNCASTVTNFGSDLTQIESVVDWEVMRAQMWANTADDPDRRRRRMAEFLVHHRVSIECLNAIVVRHDTEGEGGGAARVVQRRSSRIRQAQLVLLECQTQDVCDD